MIFFKNVNVYIYLILLFCTYLHLNKDVFYIWTNLNPTPWRFVTSMFEIGPVILEKLLMWKVYKQADRQIGGQQEIRKASTYTTTFGSSELESL